jgi:glycosyltransferase involved in cell wall biosynthesis
MSDFEFIIVNDGSTDRTKEIIATFGDPRIQFYSLDHIGRARALNYAVEKAQSPYIAFMDADDISVQERIEKQYHYLQQNPEIGLVSGWYALIDSSGMEMNILRKLPAIHEEIEYEMTSHCSMCFPATTMRRKLLNQIDGLNADLQSAVDYDLFLRLLSITKLYNIQEILLQHRILSSSISASRSIEQRYHTLKLANNYLNNCLAQSRSTDEKRKIYFRLGLTEYYHGTMPNARRWFVCAIPSLWTQLKVWRYLIATFLGDRFFVLFRKLVHEYTI